ncbi:hypothetical protein PF005_g2686 [Phytophthora fragariae]|uniref:Protein kinase domain-containing protein n=1 Tax=Phytophthora fragariae TaxID=53985 RepID=A0A6A4DWU4_9STRA|nr:hypothetical protein PF003_g4758 [Phytophthora fragariae]KAE8939406.1 hypothetical protein PF009_g10747 [Phytophthora fragariae]KAE9013816.1 hypothetical protein PF011_g8320 [Phytophthora fragariae]KAE9117339.1 hypothetical protein PF007_g9318 [Phytophthora fragariae]KAE9146405.1 hypothetical protein PF006_g8822 [Phytophthora fragariae]
MKLYCVIVGVEIDFSVEIDEGKTLDELKVAIKANNPVVKCDARWLRLFLAKRNTTEEEKGGDDGVWLTHLEAHRDGIYTRDYKYLEYDASLRAVGLASGQLGEVDDADRAAGLGPIHVLVVVPEEAPAPLSGELDVRDNLDRLEVPFATRDLNYLLDYDTAKYSSLRSTALSYAEAARILAAARSAIKSATQRAIEIREGVLLDGPLNLPQGQTKSNFYYAYSRFGGILAAKVYGEMHSEAFQREVDVNRALGSHPNIVQFLNSFSVENSTGEQRHIIVMPFFARSAADLLVQHSPVEVRALTTIARDCVSALCHIHAKKYCFADLKPANIMLHCGEQGGATLIDFGGAVALSHPIVECTDQFCLDLAESRASELLDWTCLGTTLAKLAGIDIARFHSRAELVKFLNDKHNRLGKCVRQLILSCLVKPSGSRIEAAVAPLLGSICKVCQCKFNVFKRCHQCPKCGCLVCGPHCRSKLRLPLYLKPVRVCDECFKSSSSG